MRDFIIGRILLVKGEGITLLFVLDCQRLALVGNCSVNICVCNFLLGVAVRCGFDRLDLSVLDRKGEFGNSDLIFHAVLFGRRRNFGQAVGAVGQGGDIHLACTEFQDIVGYRRLDEHGHICNLFLLGFRTNRVFSAVGEADDVGTVIQTGDHKLIAARLAAVGIGILRRRFSRSSFARQNRLAVNGNMLHRIAANLKARDTLCINRDSLIVVRVAVCIILHRGLDAGHRFAALGNCNLADCDRIAVCAELFEGEFGVIQRLAAHILFADRKRNGFIRQRDLVVRGRFNQFTFCNQSAVCAALDLKLRGNRQIAERCLDLRQGVFALRQTGKDDCGTDRMPAVSCIGLCFIRNQIRLLGQEIVDIHGL